MDDTTSRPRRPTGLVQVMNDAGEQKTFKQWGETSAGATLKPAFYEQTVWTSASQGNEWRGPPAHVLQSLLETVSQKEPTLVSESSNWENIVQQIEVAIQKNGLKLEGSLFRKYMRSATVVKFLNGMVNMIPDEKGLSVLRGGLSFVFQAWNQRIDNKEKVLETLADIPDLMSWATSTYGTFREKALLNLVRNLLEVLLTSLCCLTNILLRNHTGSWLSRTKKQLPSREAEDVRRIVIDINLEKERIETCVQSIRDARLRQVSQDIRANSRETQAIRKTANAHSHQLRTIEEAVGASSGQLQTIEETIENMRATIEQCKQELRGMVPPVFVERMQNAFYTVTTEGAYKKEYYPLPNLPHHKLRLQNQAFSISPEDLLAILCIDPLLPSRDISQVLRQGTSMRNDALQKAAWLLVTPQFKEWMGRHSSGVLLVDGNLGSTGIGRTSPLSVLSASLATQISTKDGYTTLQFFCGMHAGLQDPFSGPRGMLRLLITQLILYPVKPAFSLDFMEVALYDAVRSQDIRGLCFLFEELIIRSNPHDTILCIIDGIADLEFSPHWRIETFQVLALLQQLVNKCRVSPMLKVLFTNSNRSGSGLREMFNDGEHVSLLSGIMNLRPTGIQHLSTGYNNLGSLVVPSPLHFQPSSATNFVEPSFQDFLHTPPVRPKSASDSSHLDQN